jgi:hypothetical protein
MKKEVWLKEALPARLQKNSRRAVRQQQNGSSGRSWPPPPYSQDPAEQPQ